MTNIILTHTRQVKSVQVFQERENEEHITKACGGGSSMGQHIGIDRNLSFVFLIWGALPDRLSFLCQKKSMTFSHLQSQSIIETPKIGTTIISHVSSR